ncbi:MAG: alginate export family protein [Pseudomonadota bacterium]
MSVVVSILLFLVLAFASATGVADDAVTVRGESRARFEVLDGQFRAGRSGSDQALLMRSLIAVETNEGPVKFGFELQDSRGYFSDQGTPLSSSFVNPLDILQLYGRIDDLPKLLGPSSNTSLKLGRQTVSITSKRQIERVSYANVIKSYTGAHLTSKNDWGDELHLFYVVPIARLPVLNSSIELNAFKFDKEQWNRHIFGAHYRKANLLQSIEGLAGEVFLYGVEESDSAEFPTPNRSYLAPGFRLHRAPSPGRWDVDIEGVYRFGERRATSLPSDNQPLDVSSTMLLARIGYTFDRPWRPGVAFQYYAASGDKNPADGRFDQFERLFGGRRTDLNNTSLHGPLTPANLKAIGVRFEMRPTERMHTRLIYSASYLDSATDRWVIARLRDPTGNSGTFMGHAIDTWTQYWVRPKRLRLEVGASALLFGEFAKNVPGGPEGSRTLFAYSQITVFF